MRRTERATCVSTLQVFRAYVHTYPRKRVQRPEPKSDADRIRLGLPLREPWFEVKPFDEKKMRFVLCLKDILQGQAKQRMDLCALSHLRRELDVQRDGKQRKMATYVRRFPNVFTLRSVFTSNIKKKTWCGFTEDARKLLIEEEKIFQDSETALVQKLRKILMISMKNRLPLATVERVRQSLGLPVDFKERLINKYSEVFLLKERKGSMYLELKEWDTNIAMSVFEKNTQDGKYEKRSKMKKKPKLPIEESKQETLINREAEFSAFAGDKAGHKFLTGNVECRKLGSTTAVSETELHLGSSPVGPCNQNALHVSHCNYIDLDENEQMSYRNLDEECKLELGTRCNVDARSFTGVALSVEKSKRHELVDATGISNSPNIWVVPDVDNNESKERKQSEQSQVTDEKSLCLHFPWISKKGRQPTRQRAAEIRSFQSAPYISPYQNSRELVLSSDKVVHTHKFLVGLIHEFLSLTLEKRATINQLELFRRPYRLPKNLLDFLLKYDGIFYIVRGKKKSHVFLKEAYKEFHLIEKDPLVLWQECFVELALSSEKPEMHGNSNAELSSQDAGDISDRNDSLM
ncbi:hypothetical protein KP509_32G075800 [Ceratopteris richardii]|uniref:PORR domain-containing protein n=1 Tax=Ceratopteris richardii TaxID=49495 RepID=A0A8T2QWK0_CERRI|nr:hypothetical protein KP509_32G075800 [Ceratopteris richardii]